MNNDSTDQPQQVSRSTLSSNRHDELDLLGFFYQLWRGKRLIIITIVLMVVWVSAYLTLQSKKWTSTAIVTIPAVGQVTNYDAVLSRLYSQFPQDKWPLPSLQKQLLDRFNTLMMSYTSNFPAPFTLNIEPSGKDKDMPLRVSVTAATAQQAQQALKTAISAVDAQIVNEYISDMKLNLKQKEIELNQSLKAQATVAEAQKQQRLEVYRHAFQIAEVANIDNTQLREVDKLSDDTLFLLGTIALKAMIANENSKPLEFDEKYFETKSQLLFIQSLQIRPEALQSYSFVQEPSLPGQSDSQKKILKIILAIFAGLVMGSLLVIGRNIIRDYHSRR